MEDKKRREYKVKLNINRTDGRGEEWRGESMNVRCVRYCAFSNSIYNVTIRRYQQNRYRERESLLFVLQAICAKLHAFTSTHKLSLHAQLLSLFENSLFIFMAANERILIHITFVYIHFVSYAIQHTYKLQLCVAHAILDPILCKRYEYHACLFSYECAYAYIAIVGVHSNTSISTTTITAITLTTASTIQSSHPH